MHDSLVSCLNVRPDNFFSFILAGGNYLCRALSGSSPLPPRYSDLDRSPHLGPKGTPSPGLPPGTQSQVSVARKSEGLCRDGFKFQMQTFLSIVFVIIGVLLNREALRQLSAFHVHLCIAHPV